MNKINQHEFSSEWKMAWDVITTHLNGLNNQIQSNVSGYSKLLHAQKNGWDINRLVKESKNETDLFNPKLCFWWTKCSRLLETLENEFEIKFPREGDFEDIIQSESIERNIGLNLDITIDKLAEIVSRLVACEELDQEYYIYEAIPIHQFEKNSGWSENLKRLTRDVLYDLPIASFINDGYCHLKSIHREFGKIFLNDAISYTYNIKDIESDEVIYTYATLDELIGAGWVVD